MIDPSKLREGLDRIVKVLQEQKDRFQFQNLNTIGTDDPENIELTDGKSIHSFPALRHYGIPLVTTSIHSILRDIIGLSKSA
jgi:hypothetical protein